MSIKTNLKRINTVINRCAAGREVCLIAVSKARSSKQVEQAITAGQKHFGENYVQEAVAKIQALGAYSDLVWHFIGPIQSNKTALIAKHFDWVHSVDRLKIAKRLNDQRDVKKHGVLNVCIQVNIDNEPSKSGIAIDELDTLAAAFNQFENLSLKGLMCIPKITSNDAFSRMSALQEYYQLSELSMGMSDDVESAIKNGATMVRIGRAIFAQPTPSTV